MIEAFLNIWNPLSYSEKTITKHQFMQILEVDNVEFAAKEESYLLSNGYACYLSTQIYFFEYISNNRILSIFVRWYFFCSRVISYT